MYSEPKIQMPASTKQTWTSPEPNHSSGLHSLKRASRARLLNPLHPKGTFIRASAGYASVRSQRDPSSRPHRPVSENGTLVSTCGLPVVGVTFKGPPSIKLLRAKSPMSYLDSYRNTFMSEQLRCGFLWLSASASAPRGKLSSEAISTAHCLRACAALAHATLIRYTGGGCSRRVVGAVQHHASAH